MNRQYNLFCRQIAELSQDYPNLEVVSKEGHRYLKGVLDIPDDSGNIIGSFLIEIHYSQQFPHRFPLLFETGGDIENCADWHKYPNGQCCITVVPDEIAKCKHGISIKEFIKFYSISFFANHIHKLQTGSYKNGEYLHGFDGLKQYYSELLKTSDIKLWLSFVEHVFGSKRICLGRNELCFCNSQKKYKNCHIKIFREMADVGFEQINSDLKLIFK